MKLHRILGILFILFILSIVLCGCAMFRPVNANQWAKDFYQAKPSMGEVFAVKGANMNIQFSGVNEFTISSYEPAKSMISDGSGSSWIEKVAPWAAMAYGFNRLGSAPRTVAPQVVEQQVLVPVEGAVAP